MSFIVKTRVGVFETNSSSTHTMSISGLANFPKTPPKVKLDIVADDNIIVLGVGEYHWGYEELTGWLEIADYLIVDAYINNQVERIDYIIEALEYHFEDSNGRFVLAKHAQIGSIDHQSIGTTSDITISSFKDAYEIIFGKTTIYIDNDNH
jgi:hypothetical protein